MCFQPRMLSALAIPSRWIAVEVSLFEGFLQAWLTPQDAHGCWEDLSVAGGQARVPLRAVGPREFLPVSLRKWQHPALPAALLGHLSLLQGASFLR